MKSNGLNVIGINWDDTMEDVQAFRKEFKLTMPLVLGGSGDEAISSIYGVKGFPTNYVLDKDGVVVAQIIGGDMDAIKKALAGLGVTE
ncbi:MAG: TlpA family protein disulfide reductase [Armatimonadetes bacterium]|nr:TlpA family protein disulfide reductase [Armatimonadota bacterium]